MSTLAAARDPVNPVPPEDHRAPGAAKKAWRVCVPASMLDVRTLSLGLGRERRARKGDAGIRRPLGDQHLMLLLRLESFARASPYCWPSNLTLAEMTGVTEAAIAGMLADLEAAGAITAVYADGSRNRRAGIVLHRRLDPTMPVVARDGDLEGAARAVTAARAGRARKLPFPAPSRPAPPTKNYGQDARVSPKFSMGTSRFCPKKTTPELGCILGKKNPGIKSSSDEAAETRSSGIQPVGLDDDHGSVIPLGEGDGQGGETGPMPAGRIDGAGGAATPPTPRPEAREGKTVAIAPDRIETARGICQGIEWTQNVRLTRRVDGSGEARVGICKLHESSPGLTESQIAELKRYKTELLTFLPSEGDPSTGSDRYESARRPIPLAPAFSSVTDEARAAITGAVPALPGSEYAECARFGKTLADSFGKTDRDPLASEQTYTRTALRVAKRELAPEALAEALDEAFRSRTPGRTLVSRLKLMVGDIGPPSAATFDPSRRLSETTAGRANERPGDHRLNPRRPSEGLTIPETMTRMAEMRAARAADEGRANESGPAVHGARDEVRRMLTGIGRATG